LLPAVRFAYGNQGLHVAVETTAIIVGSLVAYLAFGRYRRHHHRSDLLVACGLGLLVVGNVARVADAVLDTTLPVAEHVDHLASWILLAALAVGAATGFVRRAEREGDEFIGWMAGGCVLAALASLSYLFFPPLNPRWFYTADLLSLGAYLLWLVGGAREIASYWSELARLAVTE